MTGLLLAAFSLTAVESAELRITVFDRSGLDEQTKASIFEGVTRIFAQARIDLVWRNGDLASAESRTLQAPEQPRKEREAEAACRARVDIALDLLREAPQGVRGSVMGMGLPFATEGLNVRVFLDRVHAAGARQNQQPTTVAAHVLAHEVGHVLLRSYGHSKSGLMAAFWTEHEYWRIANGMLLFSRSESLSMRNTLAKAGCGASRTNSPPRRNAEAAAIPNPRPPTAD
jgi:hypothetical protein